MKNMKVNTIFAIFVAVVLLCGMPQFSYAVDYYYDYDSSDDYEYVDEYGNIIEEEAEEPDENIDTSWFDSNNPKKEYHIYTEEELLGFASLVNEVQPIWKEHSHEKFKDTTIFLEKDIKLTSPWEPIGDGETVNFQGVFDGQGHTVSGIRIRSHSLYVGFFGYMEGEVKNLTLKGSVTSVNGPCGAFAGYLEENGIIDRCSANVTVRGKSKTGGIAGFNDGGTVKLCVNHGNVSGTRNVGGVVGENRGDLLNSGNHGRIESARRGAGTFGTGGVAGRSVDRRTLDRCFNTGDVISVNEAVGGVTGYTTSAGTRVSNSYSTGNIKVKKPASKTGTTGFGTRDSRDGDEKFKSYAGGVAGTAGVKGVEIVNCYCSGTITGADVTGGVIGRYLNESEESSDTYIRNNYFSGINSRGVGADFEGHPKNIFDGTRKVSASALSNGAGMLGNAFENETGDDYGTKGLPVLKWQKYRDKYEKASAGETAAAVGPLQKSLNSFEKTHPAESRKGFAVLRYFMPVTVDMGKVRSADAFKNVADKIKSGELTAETTGRIDYTAEAKKKYRHPLKKTDPDSGKAEKKIKEEPAVTLDELLKERKFLEEFETEYPAESRKGYAILRFFLPVDVDTEVDLSNLDM